MNITPDSIALKTEPSRQLAELMKEIELKAALSDLDELQRLLVLGVMALAGIALNDRHKISLVMDTIMKLTSVIMLRELIE